MILDLLAEHGITPKLASSNKGGEYHSPCPRCNGTDCFHVWPTQYDGKGSFWCRKCDIGGDCIKFLMEYNNLSFKEAALRTGKELEAQNRYATPCAPKQQQRTQPQARECMPPAEAWQLAARDLVDTAHAALLANQPELDYLASRGLPLEAVIEAQLGWVGTATKNCTFSSRKKWGLEPKPENKRPDALWIPRGIVIPNIIEQNGHTRVDSIRIRRPKADRKPPMETLSYHVMPGGGTAPLLKYSGQPVIMVFEAQLDTELVHYCAGDLVGVLGIGNSTARPDERALQALKQAKLILVCLDFDQAKDGKRAGGGAWKRWRDEYETAQRWPSTKGKDPGEDYAAGVDIRQWVQAGLPKIWRTSKVELEQQQKQAARQQQQQQKEDEALKPREAWLIKLKSGQTLCIVANEALKEFYARKTGFTTLTNADLDQLKGLDKPDRDIMLAAMSFATPPTASEREAIQATSAVGSCCGHNENEVTASAAPQERQQEMGL